MQGATTLDITGGAPEMHEDFRHLVRGARRLGRRVIDRCNLTILSEPGQEDLAAFLAAIDRVMFAPAPPKAERCRVVYVSPLKALAVDVERNLRAPLAGIRRTSGAASVRRPRIQLDVEG